MEHVSYLHGIWKYFLYCRCIGAGKVTCYSSHMLVSGKPFLQGTSIPSIKYGNWFMGSPINDNGPVSMPFFESKIINTDNTAAFIFFLQFILLCEQADDTVTTGLEIHCFADTVTSFTASFQC